MEILIASAGNATPVIDLEFFWIEENEAGEIVSFEALDGEIFACYSAACRPPTSGGTGGSNPGVHVGIGSKASPNVDLRIDAMSEAGAAKLLSVARGYPGMEGANTPQEVSDVMLNNLRGLVQVAFKNDYPKEAAVASSHWYEIANDYGARLAEEGGYNHPATAHAVLAILSPGARWPSNVRNGVEILKTVSENPKIKQDDVDGVINDLVARARLAREKAESFTPSKNKSREDKIRETQKKLDHLTSEDFRKKVDSAVGKNFNDLDGEFGSLIQARVVMLRTAGMKEIDIIPHADKTYTVRDGSQKVRVQTTATTMKAIRIAIADKKGASVEEMTKLMETVSEQSKVRAFYNNITNPKDTSQAAVTLDTHAYAGILGQPMTLKSADPLFNQGVEIGAAHLYPAGRDAMERFAPELAKILGLDTLHPNQVQSVTWEISRYLMPPKGKGRVMAGGRMTYEDDILRAAINSGDYAAKVEHLMNLTGGPATVAELREGDE